MNTIGIIFGIIYLFALIGLPIILIRKKWSSILIAYLVAAICTFLAVITEGNVFSGVIQMPEFEALLRMWVSQALMTGIIFFLILLFFRNVFLRFPKFSSSKKTEE